MLRTCSSKILPEREKKVSRQRCFKKWEELEGRTSSLFFFRFLVPDSIQWNIYKLVFTKNLLECEGSCITQWLAYVPKDPAASGSIPSVPEKISEEKIIDVAEVNQRPSKEESTQWLENVDRIHLVLTSGKLVLQKITCIHKFLPKSYE